MTFRVKLYLSISALILTIVLLAIVSVSFQLRNYGLNFVESEINDAYRRFDVYQNGKMLEMLRHADVVRKDKRVVGLFQDDCGRENVNNIKEYVDVDLLMLFDVNGNVHEKYIKHVDSIDYGKWKDKEAIKDAIKGYKSGDYWVIDSTLYQVAVTPVFIAEETQGLLLIGRNVQNWIVNSFGKIANLDVMLFDDEIDDVISNPDDIKVLKNRKIYDLIDNLNEQPCVPVRSASEDLCGAELSPFEKINVSNEKYGIASFKLMNGELKVVAYGLVVQSLKPINVMQNGIQYLMIVIGIVFILIALIPAYFLARNLSKPISLLMDASERLGNGDLETPIIVENEGEFKQFAEQLDEMRISLRNAQNELIQSERFSMIGKMASSITHDFRQPISTIYGYMQLIVMPNMTEEKRKSYSALIKRQIDRMQGMINEVLDYTRGVIALQEENIIMNEFVNEIAENFAKEAIMRKVVMYVKCEWDGILRVDKGRIERGIENIVRNAMQAIGKDGTINLKVYEREDMISIEIADSGPGINEEIQKHLYEPFMTHGKAGGTGLGLAVAKKVIEEHEGTIEYETKEKEGTRFIMSVPKKRIVDVKEKINI